VNSLSLVSCRKRRKSGHWTAFINGEGITCHFEDGAEEVLHALSAKYKLGVISNGIGEAQRNRTLKRAVAHGAAVREPATTLNFCIFGLIKNP